MKRIEQLKKYLPRTTYKKMDKTWKKFERDIAKELTSLGDIAERVPITGRTRGSAPDVESLIFSIECKYRESIPKWIKDGMDQAITSSSIMWKGDRMKVPVVFIKEKGRGGKTKNNDSSLLSAEVGLGVWCTASCHDP